MINRWTKQQYQVFSMYAQYYVYTLNLKSMPYRFHYDYKMCKKVKVKWDASTNLPL